MRRWLNVAHCQFDLDFSGSAEQIIGKMVYADAEGCTILQDGTGVEHSYTWGVIQHISLAP